MGNLCRLINVEGGHQCGHGSGGLMVRVHHHRVRGRGLRYAEFVPACAGGFVPFVLCYRRPTVGSRDVEYDDNVARSYK